MPFRPINTVDKVFADPQVVHRGMRIDLAHSGGGTVPSVRSPIRMSESPLAYERGSPLLGEHTRTVLIELGYSEAEIERLKS